MKKIIDIQEIFPILEVNDNCILSKTGALTICFEITLPELFRLSDNDFLQLHQSWINALYSLPYGTIVHKQDWYTRTSWSPSPGNAPSGFLDMASEKHFLHRPYLRHQAYLFLTRIPDPSDQYPRAWHSLTSKRLIPAHSLDQQLIDEFVQNASTFCSILTNSGLVNLKKMKSDQISSNLQYPGLIEQYCQLSVPDPSSPADSSPQLKDITFADKLLIGNTECLVYLLADAADLPDSLNYCTPHRTFSTEHSNLMMGLSSHAGLLLPCNHIVNQVIRVADPYPLIRSLELKARRLYSLSEQSRQNNITRKGIEAFLNEATKHARQLVKAHFNIIAWPAPGESAEEIKKMTATALTRIGVIPYQETISAANTWTACIPGNTDELVLFDYFDTFTNIAACLLIPDTGSRSSDSPQSIRLCDRLFGQPVFVDLTDEPMRNLSISNRNKLVVGGSGSGKSYLINHLVRTYHAQQVHTVIVDIGGSYKELVRFLGGYEFVYTESSPIRFNPFYLPPGDTLDTEKKESIKLLMAALWKKEEEPLVRSEYVGISNALVDYYAYLDAQPDIFPCFDSFYNFLEQIYCHRLATDHTREKDFDIHNFLYVLRPYHQGGEFDYLLNARQQLDMLNQRLILFELDNIKDHPTLFPIVTLIIMEVFISKMRKLPAMRKAIIIEEAWKALTRSAMGEYIKYCFKTVRKFQGEAIVITQEVDDLLSSPITRQTIVNNTDCRILLDQHKFQNRFHEIADLLSLTEHDKSLVLSLNKANDSSRKYKEVFISLGNTSMVYANEVSLEEHLLYSTEATEKERVRQYARQHGSLEAGITALAAEIRSQQKSSQ